MDDVSEHFFEQKECPKPTFGQYSENFKTAIYSSEIDEKSIAENYYTTVKTLK